MYIVLRFIHVLPNMIERIFPSEADVDTNNVPLPEGGHIPESDNRLVVTNMHIGDTGTQSFIKTQGNIVQQVTTIQEQHIHLTDIKKAKELLKQSSEGRYSVELYVHMF